jgi:polar amino acid transport system substrate-binding protein
MTIDTTHAAQLAPTGTLRVAFNLGNPLLAQADAGPIGARGVSVDLAQALAARLGVPLAATVCQTAAEAVDALAWGDCDVGFFAIDPKRGQLIAFSPPYLLIEGSYLVRAGSALQANEEVDRPGQRVVVGQGSAYDLHLSRELRQATIERAASSQAVVAHFLAGGFEVAAGVRQQLEADAAITPGLRLLPGRFMVIRQAMGVQRAHGEAAAAALAGFVEAVRDDGTVSTLLQRHGVQGAAVARAGD